MKKLIFQKFLISLIFASIWLSILYIIIKSIHLFIAYDGIAILFPFFLFYYGNGNIALLIMAIVAGIIGLTVILISLTGIFLFNVWLFKTYWKTIKKSSYNLSAKSLLNRTNILGSIKKVKLRYWLAIIFIVIFVSVFHLIESKKWEALNKKNIATHLAAVKIYPLGKANGLQMDKSGNIWICSNNNLIKIPNDHPDRPIIYSGNNYSSCNLVFDSNNNAWIIDFYYNTLTKIPANEKDNPIIYSKAKYNFEFDNSIPILIDSQNNIWATPSQSPNMLIKIPLKTPNQPIMYKYFNYQIIGTRDFTADPQGNIWAIALSGYNPNIIKLVPNQPNQPINYVNPAYKLDDPFQINSDKSGNIWIMDTNAVIEIPILDPNKPNVYSINGDDLIIDQQDNIWIANYETNTITELPADNPKKPIIYKSKYYQMPQDFTVDPKGNLWIINRGSKNSSYVTETLANKPQDVIVYSGGNYQFDNPLEIDADPQGNIWVFNQNSITKLIMKN